MEEVNETKKAEAESTCGKDYACLYDYIATNDPAFAKYSKEANEQATSIKISQSKYFCFRYSQALKKE